MSYIEHKNQPIDRLRIMVITISDTRNPSTDKSGRLMIDLLQREDFILEDYRIVKDDRHAIKAALLDGCRCQEIDVILTNGGTGLSRRDVTYEVMNTLFEKTIPGYAELFRMLSYEEIGSAAMLSRATAGIAEGTVIFSTPGSTGAVKLAMEKLILPEIIHIVGEIRKDLQER